LIKGHKLERLLLMIKKSNKKLLHSKPYYVYSLGLDKIHIALFVHY